jgi:hypothetical protein
VTAARPVVRQQRNGRQTDALERGGSGANDFRGPIPITLTRWIAEVAGCEKLRT